ncbi:hypothetical protein NEOLEDRAFT_1129473 [Neolentinus lepideus HHB14362 ss-1]|uniref:Zn(2)-C6 fungal-type domain-containing protein n=1 Tax=Neolentinus lepideus HHB14362 ss-1 TaxID=1314782 RepID=A0A165USE3_9AGAM|nr:hypothetical protein NEOLEDRAFT_1129473 [Neolentinus lepideus HHB14362 ss-1]
MEPSMSNQSEGSQVDDSQNLASKPPVVRGARACTTCRAAKMKCVGSEDGTKPCQRCKRAGVDCVFEKHRRGRKPGSKLSEASKMLRRLEKGLNSAKLKSQANEMAMGSPYAAGDSRGSLSDPSQFPSMLRPGDQFGSPSSQYPGSNQLPPLQLPPLQGDNRGPRSSIEADDEDADRNDDTMFPAKLIRKENQRNSYFQTVLHETPSTSASASGYSERSVTYSPAVPPQPTASSPAGLADPIVAGIINEDDAKLLFDLLFLRLNPFVNLFDPALHSVNYVRSRCPFLFTVLIMAGCKFFKAELYKPCQKLTHEWAVRVFAEGWKSVEVVQAFACLTYWKEPDDNRTWMYIGYACRMAVDLGLNRWVPQPPENETEFQRQERRNRERTYLVLFVHDRSLSMQTGKQWMLPECDLVRHVNTWHEEGGEPIRPEDVIVAAFVQLRRIAAETTDVFYTHKGVLGAQHNDVNYEVLLHNCNGKLTQWMDTWEHEMRRAGGEKFHFSFLGFFRLHVRLFLNSFGIQASMSPTSRASPSLQALSACYTSALDTLTIVTRDFASMSMLRYGQESVTIMTAYSAVFLLKLLRSSNTLAELHEGATNDIYALISSTADAYQEASTLSPASTSAAYHARFLRSLVANDIFKARHSEKSKQDMAIDPRLQGGSSARPHVSPSAPPQSMYPQAMVAQHTFHFPASPNLPAHPLAPGDSGGHHLSASASSSKGPMVNGYTSYGNGYSPQPPGELDVHYWRNMFTDLGFGETVESTPYRAGPSGPYSSADSVRSTQMPSRDMQHRSPAQLHSYHYMSSAPGFGH